MKIKIGEVRKLAKYAGYTDCDIQKTSQKYLAWADDENSSEPGPRVYSHNRQAALAGMVALLEAEMERIHGMLDVFEGNSSTRDALLDFARGTITLAGLKKASWPAVCKRAVDKTLQPMGEDRARMIVKRWALENGYSVRKECTCT